MSMIPLLGGFTDPWPGATTVLDFVNNQYKLPNGSYINQPSAAPGWSFSRTGTEYEATSFGLLVPFASGVPAITDLGLQVWEARTNSLKSSQDFTAADWAATKVSVTAAATTAPDGTLTGQKIAENTTTSGAHQVVQSITFTAAAWTFSVYVKPAERTWVFLQQDTVPSGSYFNLSGAGSLGSTTGTAPTARSITAVGNGWYRLSMTFTATAVGAGLYIMPATADLTNSYVGTVNSGIYAWGAQAEVGAFPGPYVATTSASATRGAASAIVNASALTAAQGTVIVSVGIVPAGAAAAFGYALGSVSGTEDGLAWQGNSTTVGHFNGSVSLQLAGADATAQPTRLALAWDANGRSIAYTGAASVASDANTRGTNTGGYVLGYRSGSRAIDTQIQRVLAYPTRLSSAQLLAAVA